MWCGGKTARSMLAGFMQHHKDVTDTEDPQTCANAVKADPECGPYFIMGSLYSFCLCIRKTAMCTFRTEIDFEDHGIPLIKVDSNMKLGEWAGLCKIDQEGKARKVVKCSACVVRDWGKESPAHDVLQEYLKANK